MGRLSPRARYSRRRLLLAPAAILVAAGIASVTGGFGLDPQSGPRTDDASLLPTLSTRPEVLTWAPGQRLGIRVPETGRRLPAGAGDPTTLLHVVSPDPGVDRSDWLERLAAAGTLPDLVTGLPSCEVRRIPIAARVTDLVRRDHLPIDQFEAGAYRALEAGGELWGLPYGWEGAEIGIALDRSRFPRAGLPSGSTTDLADDDRLANGWSWADFSSAMVAAAAESRGSGSIALERFGTIRSLPATWGAKWSDADGHVALGDREGVAAALHRFDSLRADITSAGRRAEVAAAVTPRRGAPAITPIPTPGSMRGPASVALGVGGPMLMRMGRASASSIEIEHASDFRNSLVMPLPRGTTSTADVEPLLAVVSGRPERRDAAWRLMKWLVEDGRLARAERLVPAWRAAQHSVAHEIARAKDANANQVDQLSWLLASTETLPALPRDGEARVVAPTATPRAIPAIEALIVGAVRRAPPRDPVLDGPAGLEARKAIATGLQAWEAGNASVDDVLDQLAPAIQSILDRTPGVLPM